MKIEYTVTLADYMAARRLHRQNRPALFLAYFFAVRCIPVLGLLLAAFSIHFILNSARGYSLIGPIAFILLMLTSPFWERFLANGKFSRISQPAAMRSIEVDNNENLILLWPGRSGEKKIPWANFIDFRCDRQISLLYMKKNRFLFIPTRMLSKAQRDEFNEIIGRHIAKRS
jgi:hypothetical protein